MRLLRMAAIAAAMASPLLFTLPALAGSHQVPRAAAAAEHHAAKPGPSSVLKLAPGSSYGPYSICLYSADGVCMETQGVGLQTELGPGASSFTVFVTVNGYYEFQNANGHCQYVNGNSELITGQNGCAGDSDQEFVEHCNPGCTYAIFESRLYPGTDMLVFNAETGKPVWVEAAVYGTWTKWVFEPI